MIARLSPSPLRVLLVAAVGLCLGGAKCGKGDSASPDAGLDCQTAALQTEDGKVDRCDIQACQACVDECGEGCQKLDAYPPRYFCSEKHSYTLHDFCEGWEYPEG